MKQLTVDYKEIVTLHKQPGHRMMQEGSLKDLVQHVMTNIRRVDQPRYSIMRGDEIYWSTKIERIYKRTDFPRSA